MDSSRTAGDDSPLQLPLLEEILQAGLSVYLTESQEPLRANQI